MNDLSISNCVFLFGLENKITDLWNVDKDKQIRYNDKQNVKLKKGFNLMSQLFTYQTTAVEESIKKINLLLNNAIAEGMQGDKWRERSFLLQSPTGSGKTVMSSHIVETLANLEDSDLDLAFVFLAPNKLQNQALESFKKHMESNSVSFHTTLPAGKPLDKNSITFLNWSSISSKGNNLIKDREDGRNLKTVIEATRKAHRHIILVIDEAHNTATSANSKKIIEAINPTVIFEISATPKPTSIPSEAEEKANFKHMHKVPLSEVRAEGVICKQVYFNRNLGEYQTEMRKKFGTEFDDMNSLSMFSALRERERFEVELSKEGTPYNPLMGIQLASEGSVDKDTKDELARVDGVISFLEENGLKSHEIAVYLSDRKENLDNIDDLNSPVKVVIFKTAIALGWDCPRLKTGALLRDTKTKPFAVQTLGRWMRQPLHKHFENDEVNRAYLFTESDLITAVGNGNDNDTEVIVPKDVKVRSKFLNDKNFTEFTIPSYYREANTKLPIPRSAFRNALMGNLDTLEALVDMGINPQADTSRVSMSTMRSYVMDDVDSGEVTHEEFINRLMEKAQARSAFVSHAKEHMSKFPPNDIEEFADVVLKTIAKLAQIDSFEVAMIIMSKTKLREFFTMIMMDIVDKWKKKHPGMFDGADEMKQKEWIIPLEATFDQKEGVLTPVPDDSVFVYDHFPNGSSVEESFVKLFESQSVRDNYHWMLKNGDQGETWFAIPYDKILTAGSTETNKHLFYPDYVALRKDGTLELLETKAGETLSDINTMQKLNALTVYCEELEKKLGIKVNGHIIHHSEKTNQIQKSKKNVTNLNAKDPSNWEPFVEPVIAD